MSSLDAVIESILHGSHASLSFHHLSSLLNVPTHIAQSHLAAYATAADPSPTILWHVTTRTAAGHTRVSLTTKPPSNAIRRAVWAIAPSDAVNTAAISPEALWLSADVAREAKLSAAPPHEANSLRDGRFLPIPGVSVRRNNRPDPRCVATAPSKPRPGPLLATAKSVAATSAPAAKPQSASRPRTSLFSSKRLGADSAARIRAKDRGSSQKGSPESDVGNGIKFNGKTKEKSGGEKRTTFRKKENVRKRRIAEDESDAEADAAEKERVKKEAADALAAVSDDDDDDGDGEIRAMEKEEQDQARPDTEQEEIQRELRDLVPDPVQGDGDGNTEGIEEEMKDVEEDEEKIVSEEVGEEETEGVGEERAKSPVKRSFKESFGLPSINGRSKRIRKEVQEQVMEGDYIVTKRVMKTFDEHGNEVNDEDERKDKTDDHKAKAEEPAAPRKSTVPPKPKAPQPSKSKKPSSKPNTNGSKKASKKKTKANIMSYFTKKL